MSTKDFNQYLLASVGGAFLLSLVLLYLFKPKIVKDADKYSAKKGLKWSIGLALLVLALFIGYVYMNKSKFKGAPSFLG